jgi:DNA primase
VLLPDGEDPDSFMQSRGIDGFTEYVTQNAKDFMRFKIQDVMEAAKADPYRKAEVVREMIALLAKVPDTFVRAEYVREFSNLIEVSEAQVLQEVNKAIRSKLKKDSNAPAADIDQLHALQAAVTSPAPQEVVTAKNEEPQERAIVRSLIEFGALPMSNEKTVAQYINEEVEIAMFENPLLMQLVQLFMEQYQNGIIPPMSWYTSLTDPDLCKMAVDLVQDQHELSPNWESKNIFINKRDQVYEQEVLSVVHYFKLRKVMRMIDNYMAELKDMKSDEEIIVQQQMIKLLFESKRTIAGGKGSVIV